MKDKLKNKRFKLQKSSSNNIDLLLTDVDLKDKKETKKKIIKDLKFVCTHSYFKQHEYFLYDFYHKTYKERYEYLPDKSTYLIFDYLNIPSKSFNTRNKFTQYTLYKDYFKREVILVTKKEDKDVFLDFLKRKGKIIIKPSCGSLGKGIKIIKYKNLKDEQKFFTNLLKEFNEEGFVAEEIVEQCEFLAKLNPTSLNTFRVTTVKRKDSLFIHTILRVGRMFSIVDNVASGGIFCNVDETGKITIVLDNSNNEYKVHPETKMPLKGITIPRFNEVIELVKKLSNVLTNFRYMCFDVALTENGPVLIEVNAKGSIYTVQSSLNRGLRKEFENIFKELNIEFDWGNCYDRKFLELIEKESTM